MTLSYQQSRDRKIIERVNSIVALFPACVQHFFVAIETTTTPLTRLNYAGTLRSFLDFVANHITHNTLFDITPAMLECVKAEDIERYLAYLSSYTSPSGKPLVCSNVTKQTKLAAIKKLYHYLFTHDIISVDCSAKVEMPRVKNKEIVVLDRDESRELLSVAESGYGLTTQQKIWHAKSRVRDIAIITLLLGTGIRISELVGLNNSDVNLSDNSFRVTRKGGGQAILYFGDAVRDALAAYIAEKDSYVESCKATGKLKLLEKIDNDALFLASHGENMERLGVRGVQYLVKKYARIVTPLKRISPHKLRSTFATALYNATGDVYAVATVLGHRDVNTTTQHYAKTDEQKKRDAIRTLEIESGN